MPPPEAPKRGKKALPTPGGKSLPTPGSAKKALPTPGAKKTLPNGKCGACEKTITQFSKGSRNRRTCPARLYAVGIRTLMNTARLRECSIYTRINI